MRLTSIPTEQFLILASILHHPVTEPYVEYAERVTRLQEQLTQPCSRPNLFERIVQLPYYHQTSFCGLHKTLSAKLVHKVFELLATEVGVRLNSLVVAGRDRLGHETWDCSILNLRSLHGAWLAPETFYNTFGDTLKVPEDGFSCVDYTTKWMSADNSCEACMLSRIGGDLDTVLDLQMIVKSRTRTKPPKRHREPRLNKIIEGWLQVWQTFLPADQWKARMEWNCLRAERLKAIRKALIKEKRRRRKHYSNRTMSSKLDKDGIQRQVAGNGGDTLSKRRKSICSEREVADLHLPDFRRQASVVDEAVSNDDDEDAELDTYAAFISTPFLPGMQAHEHRKRVSTLSTHKKTPFTQHDDLSWVKLTGSRAQQPPDRPHQSKNTNPCKVKDTPRGGYTPPRQQWAALAHLSPTDTLSERRKTEGTWITASFGPSVSSIPDHIARHGNLEPSRFGNDGNMSAYKNPGTSDPKSCCNMPTPTTRTGTKAGDFHDSPSSSYSIDNSAFPGPSFPGSCSDELDRPRKQEMGCRLSRPFNEVEPLPNSTLNSVKELRNNRNTFATEMTHWSAPYGADADRIRRAQGDLSRGRS